VTSQTLYSKSFRIIFFFVSLSISGSLLAETRYLSEEVATEILELKKWYFESAKNCEKKYKKKGEGAIQTCKQDVGRTAHRKQMGIPGIVQAREEYNRHAPKDLNEACSTAENTYQCVSDLTAMMYQDGALISQGISPLRYRNAVHKHEEPEHIKNLESEVIHLENQFGAIWRHSGWFECSAGSKEECEDEWIISPPLKNLQVCKVTNYSTSKSEGDRDFDFVLTGVVEEDRNLPVSQRRYTDVKLWIEAVGRHSFFEQYRSSLRISDIEILYLPMDATTETRKHYDCEIPKKKKKSRKKPPPVYTLNYELHEYSDYVGCPVEGVNAVGVYNTLEDCRTAGKAKYKGTEEAWCCVDVDNK